MRGPPLLSVRAVSFAKESGGKHWIRYGYEDLAGLAGGSGAYLQNQMQNSTPNQSVKLLLASGDVKKAGEEKVRGVATTHYSGTVNVADLAGRTSGLTAAQADSQRKQLTQAGVDTEQSRRCSASGAARAAPPVRPVRERDGRRSRGRTPPGARDCARPHGRRQARGAVTTGGRGRICLAAIRSRTLLEKPKTAGRCRVLSRGHGGRRIR